MLKKQIGTFSVYPILLLIFIVLLTNQCSNTKKTAEEAMPPKPEKIPKSLTIHGDIRVDNYFWLNQRDNPKVIDYLTAENDYKGAVMKHTEKITERNLRPYLIFDIQLVEIL